VGKIAIAMFKFIKAKKWVFAVVSLVTLVILYSAFSSKGEDAVYDFAEATYLSIVQDVSVTGTVEADSKINLRFQSAGQVQKVYYDVGDFVYAGDTIAYIDTTALSIKVAAAQADLALANANYNQAVAGSTEEAIKVAEAALNKAEADLKKAIQDYDSMVILAEDSVASAELAYNAALTDYNNAGVTYGEGIDHAYEDAYNVIDDVFNEVDDTLRDIDNILGVDNETSNDDIELALEANNRGDYNVARSDYTQVQNLYDDVFVDFSSASSSDFALVDQILLDCEGLLDDTSALLDDVDDILANAPILGGLTETVKDSKRTILASEMNDINTIATRLANAAQAIDSADTSEASYIASYADDLASAKQAYETAQAQASADIASAEVAVAVYEALVAQAEASLADTKVGPREVDLASLSAAIASAQASVDLAAYNLSEAYVTAPTNGVITEVYFDEGENITAVEDFVTMLSEQYQIIANVSETDISKVHIGDKVMMTLDAFSYDKEFEAEIAAVDPAETVVQGVIYYQVTAVFTAEDTDIKSGMTANMDIITAEVDDVLAVPIRAIKYDGSRVYVFMLDGTDLKEVDVEIGVAGDQYVEILSGLKEGDEVVTYVR